MGWESDPLHQAAAPTTTSMRLRAAVPDALVPAVVAARIRRKARKPEAVARARAEMEFLIGAAAPQDLDRAARAYLERDVWRSELRYHPKQICYQHVENIASLVKARATDRGVVVSFLHHGHYEGATAALAHHDRPITVVVSPDMLAADAPTFLRQHVVAGTVSGSRSFNAAAGAKAMVTLLADGDVLAIATDVPGSSELDFLGRTRLGSSGAARMAAAANSLVITMHAHCEPDGRLWLSLSDPIEPRDFATPDDLLRDLVSSQEDAVLAWPEGYHQPSLRWGVPTPTGTP